MKKREIARVESLVAATTRPKTSPPPLLAYLRRQLKRVEKGETVLLVYPGLPLYAMVPVSDRKLIEQIERLRNPSRRKRRTVSMTVEELAQCLEGMLRQKTVSKRAAGRVSSASRASGKAARTSSGPSSRKKADRKRDRTRGRPGEDPVGASDSRRRPERADEVPAAKTEVMEWPDAQLAADPEFARAVEERVREMKRESRAYQRRRAGRG